MIEMLVVVGSLLAAWAACHPVMWIAKNWRLWDRPNDRSSHTRPTLRGGGIGSIVVVLVVILLWINPMNPDVGIALFISVVVLTLVGLADDMKGVPIWIRLLAQIIAATYVAGALPIHGYFYGAEIVAVICLVALSNFVNFMDGINGLVSGQATIMALGLWVLGSISGWPVSTEWTLLVIVFGGAAAGFMPHNFPTARIFLGDAGSVPFGFILGVCLLWAMTMVNDAKSVFAIAAIPSYFVVEGLVAILCRVFRSERWWTPHRTHAYQLLVRTGWSHTKTACLIFSIQTLITLLLCFFHSWDALDSALFLICVAMWIGFCLYAHYLYRRTQAKNGKISN